MDYSKEMKDLNFYKFKKLCHLENVDKRVNKKVLLPLLLIMASNKKKEEAENVREMTNISPKHKIESLNSEKFLLQPKKMVLPSKKDKD